ncbi:hypothetical protein [Lelliottia nimipressuralis]
MNPNRKPPQKFDNMWDLITELNAAGHPDDNLWYKGDIRAGEELIFSPRYFLSAASRLIGQRNSDGIQLRQELTRGRSSLAVHWINGPLSMVLSYA